MHHSTLTASITAATRSGAGTLHSINQHALLQLGSLCCSLHGSNRSKARLAAKQQAEPVRQRAEAPGLKVVALHCLAPGEGCLPAAALRQPCVELAACKLVHRVCRLWKVRERRGHLLRGMQQMRKQHAERQRHTVQQHVVKQQQQEDG